MQYVETISSVQTTNAHTLPHPAIFPAYPLSGIPDTHRAQYMPRMVPGMVPAAHLHLFATQVRPTRLAGRQHHALLLA